MAYKIKHSHALDIAGSKVKLEQLASDLEKQYSNQVNTYHSQWVSENQFDFSLKYFGVNVTGSIILENQSITVEYNLPFLLRWNRSEIDKRIKNRLENMFEERN